MNKIYLLKKDLETYTNNNISILAKYYYLSTNISYNDLLWVLAIKIGSQKASMKSGWPTDIIQKSNGMWALEGETETTVPQNILQKSYEYMKATQNTVEQMVAGNENPFDIELPINDLGANTRRICYYNFMLSNRTAEIMGRKPQEVLVLGAAGDLITPLLLTDATTFYVLDLFDDTLMSHQFLVDQDIKVKVWYTGLEIMKLLAFIGATDMSINVMDNWLDIDFVWNGKPRHINYQFDDFWKAEWPSVDIIFETGAVVEQFNEHLDKVTSALKDDGLVMSAWLYSLDGFNLKDVWPVSWGCAKPNLDDFSGEIEQPGSWPISVWQKE